MGLKMMRLTGLTAVFLATIMLVIIMQKPATPALSAGSEGFVYLPLVLRPANVDLTITAIEVNQSVQRANNSVPLVANRNTLVRVYAQALTDNPVHNVVVRLTATRDGNTIGHLDSAPIAIPLEASRDNAGSTINFQLPPAWLFGNVTLTAVVDANNAIAEVNEENNTLATGMAFNNVPNLQIVIVPIHYTHTGPTNPGFYPAQSVDYISDWLMRAYPIADVDITMRTPYAFSGNLQAIDAWVNEQGTGLLDRMYQMKLADGYPENTPVVYYAFVPTRDGSTRWFFSGIAGIGWIGARESVGLNLGNDDRTGALAAHEIGHNLGRRHAPCGNPAGVDPFYPYAGASIGEYGIDIPQGVFWTPFTAVDIMSYCDPAWLSDYTYIGLYNDQMAHGFATTQTARDSMVVTAGLDENGTVTLHPTYAYAGYVSTATTGSDYQVELLDESGNVLASQPMQLREAEEQEVRAHLLTAVLPLSPARAAAIRIVQADMVLVEREFGEWPSAAAGDGAAVAAARAGDTIVLSWNPANLPAIVRYSADGGRTWTALGLGVVGGAFTVEAGALPRTDNILFEIIPADMGRVVGLTAVLPE